MSARIAREEPKEPKEANSLQELVDAFLANIEKTYKENTTPDKINVSYIILSR